MYNRYEIVMEYDKRPRLPPPFVVISYISMLLSSCGRQCVLKLQSYSNKKTDSAASRRAPQSTLSNDNDNVENNQAYLTPLVSRKTNDKNLNNASDELNDQLTETDEDRSFLGYLLRCKPCQAVTDKHKEKTVCYKKKRIFSFIEMYVFLNIYLRMQLNVIGKIVKQIFIGNIKQKNFMLKLKKLIKFKKNLII